MIITQAYKYIENNATLFFPESSKHLLDGDYYVEMQGELVDVICEIEGDYSMMYEPAHAQDRIQYLEFERDLFGDETAQEKINQITALL